VYFIHSKKNHFFELLFCIIVYSIDLYCSQRISHSKYFILKLGELSKGQSCSLQSAEIIDDEFLAVLDSVKGRIQQNVKERYLHPTLANSNPLVDFISIGQK